jgi:hypothetical protein
MALQGPGTPNGALLDGMNPHFGLDRADFPHHVQGAIPEFIVDHGGNVPGNDGMLRGLMPLERAGRNYNDAARGWQWWD